MLHKKEQRPVEQYLLRPGYIYVPVRPTVISVVLGTCVAVCLFDVKRQSGGVNHFYYPATLERQKATAQYGNVATAALVNLLIEGGSKPKHLRAQVFGGAHNPQISEKDIGRDNVRVARRVLAKKRVAIVSEDVGGRVGRKIVFNTHTNEIAVVRAEQLRRGDWYPYASDR